jgi:hypothetical protein
MAIAPPTQPASKLLDKRLLQQIVADLDERMGFVHDPAVSAEQVQDMMLADGIRPEDRFLSSEIIRVRYEHEEV